MAFKVVSFFLFLFFFLLPVCAFAQEDNSFVTIVNPQRIAPYNKDYLNGFLTEKREVEKRGLPATWLLTYDVLNKPDFVKELKKMNDKQELGIFLEVTESFSNAAGVSYNKTGGWHFANSLFLSGYSQEERVKLINTVFKKFKDNFGYYPKSVGSWWTDAYSQTYMGKRYGITGNLGVSDQYELDGYSVWGTWWSVPYYPSKFNAAMPAQNENKLNILQLRWAARDPLNGYRNDLMKPSSMYSLQDYSALGLPSSYYQNLLNIFALQNPYNKFGHATIGLEGDLGVEIYKSFYSNHLNYVSKLNKEGKLKILNMEDFSKWYFQHFTKLSPKHLIEANDLLGTNKKIFWFQSPIYRVGVEYDINTNKAKVIDLRNYFSNFKEPFYKDKNEQYHLYINLPSLLDSYVISNSEISFNLGKFKKIEDFKLLFENGNVEFREKELLLGKKKIKFNTKFPILESGITYTDSSISIPFALKRRLPKSLVHLIPRIPFGIPINYSISQEEYSALKILKKLPYGNVLVYEKDCLNCSYSTTHKPAAMAGKKNYISKYSSKPINISYEFQFTSDIKNAKKLLKDNNIQYVYLTNYSDFMETLPNIPNDLGLKRVYVNANAEIWKVK